MRAGNHSNMGRLLGRQKCRCPFALPTAWHVETARPGITASSNADFASWIVFFMLFWLQFGFCMACCLGVLGW